MTLTDALAKVWGRILFNEQADEQHGFNRGRSEETEGLYLVLEVLSNDDYSDEVANAEDIARERFARRQQTRSNP